MCLYCADFLNIIASQLYYHAGSLLTYMGLKHDGEVNSKIVDGVEVRFYCYLCHKYFFVSLLTMNM